MEQVYNSTGQILFKLSGSIALPRVQVLSPRCQLENAFRLRTIQNIDQVSVQRSHRLHV